jgi:hypothetical protein
MHVLRLALVGVIAVAIPIAAEADWPVSAKRPANARPAPGVVRMGDRGGPVGRLAAGGGPPATGQFRQWPGGGVSPHWRPGPHPHGWGPFGWQGVPTYWVWGPSGGAFDYPFADWRGPTGGWGNP